MNKPNKRLDFSSAALVALTGQVLGQINPDLLPADISLPDPFSGAGFDPGLKTKILNHAYNKGGAYPIVSVGKYADYFLKFPIGKVLVRTKDADVLAHKWMRMEKYNHATHRVKIKRDGNSWICTRHWKGNDEPTLSEDLLVSGILAGVLRISGFKNVSCQIGDLVYGDNIPVSEFFAVQGDTKQWCLSWETSEQPLTAGEPDNSHGIAIVDRLQALLLQDISRSWNLPDVSRQLGKSQRTLQREIKAAGHSFSSVMRISRGQAACEMLEDPTISLAEIGFCCGYSDQAHFQRDFKRSTNMTPEEFRRLLQE